MPTTYLTPTEVAAKLKISRQAVSQYMEQGRIPFVVIAGRRLIDSKDAKKPEARKPGRKPV
jgi:excisionase family DNA binding protein